MDLDWEELLGCVQVPLLMNSFHLLDDRSGADKTTSKDPPDPLGKSTENSPKILRQISVNSL